MNTPMNSETNTPATPPRRRRWLRYTVLSLFTLVMLLFFAVVWLLDSGAGLRFALAQAERFTHGALQVEQAEGSLAGPLDIASLRYQADGTNVTLRGLHLEWRPRALLIHQLHVVDLRVASIDVALPKSQATSSSSSSGFELQPPIAMLLDHVSIGPTRISEAGAELFVSNQLDLAGRWTSSGLSLTQLKLLAPQGHAEVVGQLGLGKSYRGNGHLDASWKVGKLQYAGHIAAQGDGKQATLDIKLSEPMLAQLQLTLDQAHDNAWKASLALPAFDPKPLLGDSALHQLGAQLHGEGDAFGGTLEGELDLNQYRLLLQPLQAKFDKNYATLSLQQLQLASPQIKGEVSANGTVQLKAQPLSAQLQLGWKGLQIPAELAGQALASSGQLNFAGSAEQYHAQGDVDIGPPGKLAKLALNVDGTPQQVTLHTLSLLQPQGKFETHGVLNLQPELSWQLEASADRFDPGQLLADWNGSINADFATDGKLPVAGPDVTLDLRSLQGTLRQRPLLGSGKLHVTPDQVLNGSLQLASGGSTVQLDAQGTASNNAVLKLAIASLGDWLPQAGGKLSGQFNVRGKLPKLSVDGSLQGQALTYEQQHIGRLNLQASVPDISAPGGKLALELDQAKLSGLDFSSIALNGQGTAAQHQLSLDAKGQPLSLSLRLNGALKGQNWNGNLSTLNIDASAMPQWRLQQPVQLAYNDGNANLGKLCLTAGAPSLCVNGSYDKGGNVDASYQLHALPLTLLVDAAGNKDMPVSADGNLEGSGHIQRNAAGSLSGNASITSSAGRFTYNDHPDQPLLTYNNLALTAQLAPGSQQLSLQAGVNQGGKLDGHISLSGADQALSGELSMHLDNIAFVGIFTDVVANLKGRMDGDFKFGGTLNQPAITGSAGLSDFAAEVPDAGLKLSNGKLSLSAANAHQLNIDGSVQSGKGTVNIGGIAGLDAQTASRITLKGSQFTAVDIPAAKVVISPDLLLLHDAKGVNASGSVRLDSASVNLDKLPNGGATKASPDVVVVNAPQTDDNDGGMPIFASIRVDLGNHTHLSGMGVDGDLTGALTVNEQPGQATTGQGQIAIDGTYKAYGQNLTIKQGQLLFASTPIDNPGLNIRAGRSLDPTATIDNGEEVGLEITGTAKRPVLNVYSDPLMDQSDALSYLVTGKPLSQVGSGEGSTVNAAAQALGSAAGNYLSKNVGSKIGLDDIGVSSSDALNGSSAFTVGKYLSPRLYISYGVGLFDPGEVITLRYKLSRRWSFEAQNATEYNRASLNYRIEK